MADPYRSPSPAPASEPPIAEREMTVMSLDTCDLDDHVTITLTRDGRYHHIGSLQMAVRRGRAPMPGDKLVVRLYAR